LSEHARMLLKCQDVMWVVLEILPGLIIVMILHLLIIMVLLQAHHLRTKQP